MMMMRLGSVVVCVLALAILGVRTQSTGEPLKTDNANSTAEGPLTISMGIPCPTRCILGLAPAWTKTISFDVPTSTMIDDKVMMGKEDMLQMMCALYASYSECLKRCDADNEENKLARDVSPEYSEICSDKTEDIQTSSPCIRDNAQRYKTACKKENELALAAAIRLSTSPKSLDHTVLDDYCSTATDQLYCLFPMIRQTCGNGPYNLIRSIANASHASVRLSIGEQTITDMYPKCKTYLKTIDEGIPLNITESVLIPKDTTIIPNVTMATNGTTLSVTTISLPDSNTTQVIRKDDAGGVDDSQGRMGGTGSSQFQTTTAETSSAAKRYLNFMIVILFSVSCFIFM